MVGRVSYIALCGKSLLVLAACLATFSGVAHEREQISKCYEEVSVSHFYNLYPVLEIHI
jgi:hypothetical protein